jgi:ketosteroid isomerase-like protein
MPDQPQTAAQLLEMIRQGALFSPGTVVEGRETFGMLERLLPEVAAPDFVTIMHSESAALEYEGIAGFREALTDWMSPYDSFRLAFDEVVVEDDKVVFLVRQLVRTKHEGVEMETPSGTVWWLEGGRISQAVFYLDQHSALQAAGIDPDRPANE